MKNGQSILALVVCIIIALISNQLAGMQNIIGGPMIGLLIGMLLVNIIPSSVISDDFQAGTKWVGKKFLNLGIILTGGTLSFLNILGYGARAMPLLIFNVFLSFFVAYFVGKRLGVTRNTATLVGSGTAICGGTAISSTAAVIEAKEDEIAYAMTAIFLFDVVSALVYPYLAEALNLTHNQFAFLAGSSINDTSSVVAAETTYSALNGIESNLAITVKLARTTLLVFIILFFSLRNVKAKAETGEVATNQPLPKLIITTIPTFIYLFLLMAILNTLGVFDMIHPELTGWFSTFSKLAITTALAGIGFKIRFKDLFTDGTKPVILGGINWLALAISSIIFIHVFSGYVG